MHGPEAEHYIDTMKKEIKQLMKIKNWKAVPKADVPTTSDGKPRTILKGTWAFKLKRSPDGKALKYKARYCCRGDLQTQGVDFFETFAPVVQWSTIRILLTLLALANNWKTRQVDYTNAFAQANINEQVYIEPPGGFLSQKCQDSVLHLQRSLYGEK